MADLTIQEQCGVSATISNGVLSITLIELGLDTTTPSSSQVLGALMLKRYQLQENNTTAQDDVTVGCVVEAPFLGFARNDSQINARYTVNLYKIAPATSISDPDDIVS
ncbi:MAG: hypothetical protein RIG63_30305 [Coleofasciculus chthonoplastes F3-SA18-01]|uniref:hypothetical protein n=1 Tax=Coleofasciculus chthonoplastes TaxID=64178 RepID=UPI0032FC7608